MVTLNSIKLTVKINHHSSLNLSKLWQYLNTFTIFSLDISFDGELISISDKKILIMSETAMQAFLQYGGSPVLCSENICYTWATWNYCLACTLAISAISKFITLLCFTDLRYVILYIQGLLQNEYLCSYKHLFF